MVRFAARTLRAGISVVAVLGASVAGAALPQRTFVASYGLDTNACSVTSPCRSFATAISKTNPTGEVIVLDSAGYGPVTITQSVSIIAPPGVYAGITVPTSTTGILVNGSGILVRLSGLTLNGLGGGGPGINFQQGARLVVERCTIENMLGRGLIDTSSSSELYITDTTIRYSAAYAIDIEEGTATLDRVRVENNAGGVYVFSSFAPVNVLARDTVASQNINSGFSVTAGTAGTSARLDVERSTAYASGNDGFVASALAGATATLTITDSKSIGGAQSGIHADNAGAAIVLSGSTSARNAHHGLEQSSGASFVTLQNNTVQLNGLTPTSGTITNANVQ